MNKFEILNPTIFPENVIISGVTKKNLKLFPEKGFSISNLDYFSKNEIIAHRKYLAFELGFQYKQLKFQKQVHKTDIQLVNPKTANDKKTDGMITNEKGIILNISIADCTAILIYDSVNNAIGAIHSGWRGTAANIALKSIELLNKTFKSEPHDLLVYLSPCASGRKYEVGKDVAYYFPESSIPIGNNKYLYDNQKQIIMQLLSAGILKHNIEASNICTISNKDYHSYRRDKEKSGRMSAFIGLITP